MRLLVFAAILPVLAAVVLACGGDSAETPTPAPSATATPWSGQTEPFVITPSQVALREDFGVVIDVRIGAHPEEGGFNRFVIEFAYGRPAGHLQYFDKNEVVSCGPGFLVPLKGETVLLLTLQPSAQHLNYVPTSAPRELLGPGPSILEAKNICDFEAVVQWAIGTSGRQPFRVTYLDSPSRIVIDVKNP